MAEKEEKEELINGGNTKHFFFFFYNLRRFFFFCFLRFQVTSEVVPKTSANNKTYLTVVGRAFGADPAEQRRLVPPPGLAGRHVFALRPLVPVRVRAEEAQAAVPRAGRQLAEARLAAPAARLDGRELQRRGPQRGLVAAGQEQLEHLRVVHALHRFAVDVRDQVAGAESRLERRTAGVHGLLSTEI